MNCLFGSTAKRCVAAISVLWYLIPAAEQRQSDRKIRCDMMLTAGRHATDTSWPQDSTDSAIANWYTSTLLDITNARHSVTESGSLGIVRVMWWPVYITSANVRYKCKYGLYKYRHFEQGYVNNSFYTVDFTVCALNKFYMFSCPIYKQSLKCSPSCNTSHMITSSACWFEVKGDFLHWNTLMLKCLCKM